jgi:predicted porin
MYQGRNCPWYRSLFGSVLFTLLFSILTTCVHAQQAPVTKILANAVTCLSKPGERRVCNADTSQGVALLRPMGDATCLLGKNWGYDDASVWVSNGCGGQFAVAGPSVAGAPATAVGATVAPAAAAATGGTKETNAAHNVVGMFEPYGQIRIHFAAYKNDAEVQDNATRVGINFATRGRIKAIAGTEWGVNLVQSETQFNLSGAGSSGAVDFPVLSTQVVNPVFVARLGFIGADFGPVGKVTVGKQYAPQYDIASYTTDRFNVFGGQGTFAYIAGTDGGPTGTGRADRAVQYRNTILKILDVGFQTQFRAVGNDHTADGVGASLQVKLLPGLKVGGTYTRTNWAPVVKQEIPGIGGNADYFAVGTRLDWKILQFGGVYAHQHNGDIATVVVPNTDQLESVGFNASGYEIYTRVGVRRFGLIGGFTYQDPKVRNPLLNPDFKTRYFILGGEYFLAENAKIYSESRIDDGSVTATGDKGYDVFTIGFRYDFSLHLDHEP